MNIFLTFLLSFVTCFASAQFGVSGAWQSLQADEWHTLANPQNNGNLSAATGYAASLDYWFRLKQRRVEFLPELSYSRQSIEGKFEHRLLSFFFNVNVYPFDFESDCDCPVWSKQGNFFTKGFYLQLSPGLSHVKNSFETNLIMEDETIAFAIGGGAGIDIGLSDLLTVTPFFRYHFYPNATWEALPNSSSETTDIESDVKVMSAGIRIGFRPKKSG